MKIKHKKSISILKIALLIGVSVLLLNCEKEDYEATITNPHVSHEEFHNPIQKIKYADLKNDNDLKKIFHLVEKHTTQKSENLVNKRLTENEKTKLLIIKDEVVKIEKNNVTTWTFGLKRNLLKDSDFENLLIKKYLGNFEYYLVTYKVKKDLNTELYLESTVSYPIKEEYFDFSHLDLQSRGDVFDWASPDDGGGGIETSEPCYGETVPVYER